MKTPAELLAERMAERYGPMLNPSFWGVYFGQPAVSGSLRERLDECDRYTGDVAFRSSTAWLNDSPACVYFIEAPAVSMIKIGHSISPLKRLAEIATISPVPLQLLASIEGRASIEIGLHRAFADVRSHGEWFRDHPDLRELIALVRSADQMPARPNV